MVKSIEAVQPQNIYKVDAVSFLGNNRYGGAALPNNNILGSPLFTQQQNNEYNLNHPFISGSDTQAQSIDFLA